MDSAEQPGEELLGPGKAWLPWPVAACKAPVPHCSSNLRQLATRSPRLLFPWVKARFLHALLNPLPCPSPSLLKNEANKTPPHLWKTALPTKPFCTDSSNLSLQLIRSSNRILSQMNKQAQRHEMLCLRLVSPLISEEIWSKSSRVLSRKAE